MIVTLTFVNRTDGSLIDLRVDRKAVAHIMDWYGAFYAGDDYDALVNGQPANMGRNGELEPVTIDATVTSRHRATHAPRIQADHGRTDRLGVATPCRNEAAPWPIQRDV